jgi:hypothetical protein
LLPFPDAEYPGEYADHATDRSSQHAADRSSRLVAGLRSLLHALDQALSISCGGCVEKQEGNHAKREGQSQLRARGQWPADHYLISLSISIWPERFWSAPIRPSQKHYRLRTMRVHHPTVQMPVRKALRQE